MVVLRVFSLNCHGVNDGIIRYLNDACDTFDILLLQETWLSNNTYVRLDEISSGLSVFYARRLSVERNSYSDVAGWVAGSLGGCLSQPVLYQND